MIHHYQVTSGTDGSISGCVSSERPRIGSGCEGSRKRPHTNEAETSTCLVPGADPLEHTELRKGVEGTQKRKEKHVEKRKSALLTNLVIVLIQSHL